jgi:hypothetical protein
VERVSVRGTYSNRVDALWYASCITFFENEEVEYRLDYRRLVPGPWQIGKRARYGARGPIKDLPIKAKGAKCPTADQHRRPR